MLTPAPHDTPAERRWLTWFSAGIVAVYAVLLIAYFQRVGGNDNDQFLVFHELQYWNARLFDFSKQWTPVMAGGLSIAADPQVPLLSLSMVLAYLLGPFYGLRVATILYFAAGWWGAWLYSRLWTERRTVRALAASLFIGNGFFVCRLAHGHMDAIPFLTLPLALWFLHDVTDRLQRASRSGRIAGAAAAMLWWGAGAALVADGAPVVMIHYFLWVAIYAVALAAARRSPAPLLVLAGGSAIAGLLDAGYLWPMLAGQAEFPRRTPDVFTNPLVLLWFMVLPVTGQVIPAPANGHEYSVFIGPILLGLVWRYRRELFAPLPRAVRWPILVTSLAAVLLGMGSLKSLGVPTAFSPFDWLRPLPGFRSMGVTGRYWGFLALPLAMAGALAVAVVLRRAPARRGVAALLATAVALQLIFQARAIIANFGPSRCYQPVPYTGLFGPEGAAIEYLEIDEPLYQSTFITPVRGVINAYNMGDFIRPAMQPGYNLLRTARLNGRPVGITAWLDARFLSWNRMEVRRRRDLPAALTQPGNELSLMFHQAYNRHWQPTRGTVTDSPDGNLVLRLAPADLAAGPVVLTFFDPLSHRAARVSRLAWVAWCAALPLALAGRQARRAQPDGGPHAE